MTSIMLFSSTATKVSPESFAALPAHAQCELVLLLSERRFPLPRIAKAVGRTEAEVCALRAQTPLYRLPNPDIVAAPEGRGEQPRKVAISRSARRVLRLFTSTDDGVLQLDRDTIARRADLSAGVVKSALEQLHAEGMVDLRQEGRPYSPAIWALLDAGREELARIAAGDAHA